MWGRKLHQRASPEIAKSSGEAGSFTMDRIQFVPCGTLISLAMLPPAGHGRSQPWTLVAAGSKTSTQGPDMTRIKHQPKAHLPLRDQGPTGGSRRSNPKVKSKGRSAQGALARRLRPVFASPYLPWGRGVGGARSESIYSVFPQRANGTIQLKMNLKIPTHMSMNHSSSIPHQMEP